MSSSLQLMLHKNLILTHSDTVFSQAVLEIIHSVPKRTRVWLLGDFNGHVGRELNSIAVGRLVEQVRTNNSSCV